MSETQVIQHLINGHTAFVGQLEKTSTDLASLALNLPKRKRDSRELGLVGKANAMTALYEQISLLTALIEFIESLGVINNTYDKRTSMKDELQRRHTQLVYNINREVPNQTAAITDMNALLARTIERGEILHVGEKFRNRLGSNHARLMKDLAIIAYLQQFVTHFKPGARWL